MKNKDGIIIKAGQQWRTVALDVSSEVVSVYSDGDSLLMINGSLHAYYPEEHIAHILIKSHDGADLEAARAEGWEVWVEGMEKPDKDNLSRCCWWDKRIKKWMEVRTSSFDPDRTYRYKLKAETIPEGHFIKSHCGCVEKSWTDDSGTHTEKTLCDMHGPQEQPKYKLFEIGWLGSPMSFSRCADIGCETECGYRIFGFTDDENWSDRYKNTAERGSFVDVPCDAYGNRRFAIGRLENGR